MSNIENLTIEQGSTFIKKFKVTDGNSENKSLVSCTARMKLKTNLSDVTAALELTTENTGIVLSTTTNEITVKATATQTAALAAGKYFYDFELVESDGTVSKPKRGVITVLAEVTK